MTDDEHRAALWALWDGGAAFALACIVVAVGLMAVHVAALHGRRIASVQSLRTATAFVIGPLMALPPLLLWPIDLLKVISLAAVVGLAAFSWRQRRMRDLGVLLASGAVAWSAYLGGLLVLEPGFGVDYRHGAFTAGLGLVLLGVVLILFPPASRPRPITPADRYFWIERSIERAQALGPFPTPAVLAVILGSPVLVLTYLALSPAIGQPGAAAFAVAAFAATAGGALLLGTPPIVRRARRVNDAISARDRRTAATVLGTYPPMTMEQMRGLVDQLPDVDPVRPLRVEVLIAGGQLDEAREQLERLPVETIDQQLTRASLVELWSAAAEDGDRRDGIRAVLAEASSAELRDSAAIALACADARRQPQPGAAALEPIARLDPVAPPTRVPFWILLARWLTTTLALLIAAGLSLQVALMLARL